ncbi:hypothetical protein HBI56_021650 [Parastagonospora nodorum]|nr:hypothetical protein HBH49_029490 [Parastagonospora nodorum]KAH4912156.1 hypothetical protein HBI80_007210 [Parastagonospora nodorum]KAH5141569.1 hypothetical protein HBI73_074710 [Parastagonospora nodorum]KAH5149262.1 hypothetical protein HBH69_160940 [Parastagonospora nodorum]KAH5196887.1 hypothetical protein HBH76_042850 [Parastagonospora nodorum]
MIMSSNTAKALTLGEWISPASQTCLYHKHAPLSLYPLDPPASYHYFRYPTQLLVVYTHSSEMDVHGGAGPGYAPEASEYPASFVRGEPHMHQQYMEPYGGPAFAHDYQQPRDGHGFVPQPSPSAEVQGFQHPPNGSEFAPQFDPSAEGPIIKAPLTLEPPALQVPLHLQDLCARYVASYDNESIPNADRMRAAQDLALALLEYYYPACAGYVVQSSSLGPVAKHGLNFMLKAADGSDPDFTALPPKKGSKKGKTKKPSKKQLAEQIEKEAVRQFGHYWSFTTSVIWHMIKTEDIAGFEVLKKIPSADGSADEYRPYTYLAIMIDNLQTFPQFAGTNDVHRGDVLTDVLCRSQHILEGHGILLFGTRLEFYDFCNGAGFDPDAVEAGFGVEEPSVMLGEGANLMDLAVDLRATGLQTVDLMFKEATARKVICLDESVDDDANDGADGELDADGEYEVAPNSMVGE